MATSLSAVGNTQLSALTGRRVKTPYNLSLISQIPAARAAEQTRLENKYRTDALNLDKDQFNTSLAQSAKQADATLEQSKDQFNTSLAQTVKQFNEEQALKKTIAETQADQADTAGILQGAGTVLSLASLTKDAWLPAAKKLITSPGTGAATVADAANTGAAAGSGALNAETVNLAADRALDAGYAGAGESLSSVGSGVIAGVLKAAPYYALAKAGGMAVNAITENNPSLKETPFGQMGGSLKEPLAVEDYFAGELADHGVGNEEVNEYVLTTGNPLEVGSWFTNTTDKALDTVTGGLYTPITQIFCFTAGTPIDMADNTTRPVEMLNIGDETYAGGAVYGVGKVLADNIHDYRGIQVEGHHAVFESGRWLRVKDSDRAHRINMPDPVVVYPVVTKNHLLVINGVIFADLCETDQGTSVSDDERLTLLNSQTSRNQVLKEIENDLKAFR